MMKNVIQSLTALVAILAEAQHVNAGVLGTRQVGGCASLTGGTLYTYDVTSTQKNQLGDPVTSDWNCVGSSGEIFSFPTALTVQKLYLSPAIIPLPVREKRMEIDSQ